MKILELQTLCLIILIKYSKAIELDRNKLEMRYGVLGLQFTTDINYQQAGITSVNSNAFQGLTNLKGLYIFV